MRYAKQQQQQHSLLLPYYSYVLYLSMDHHLLAHCCWLNVKLLLLLLQPVTGGLGRSKFVPVCFLCLRCSEMNSSLAHVKWQ